MYQISGNTFPHRETLKALGCKWNPVAKAWETGNPATYREALILVGATKRGALPFEPAPCANPSDKYEEWA